MNQIIASILIVSAVCLAGCGDPRGNSAVTPSASAPRGAQRMLTKEEVSVILGHPVIGIEGQGMSLTYKTDILSLETAIEVDEKNAVDDAMEAMTGARTATGLLGGKAEPVAGLGDDAFFGAMSILYVRKGENVITITPPNLQLVAGMDAYAKVRDAKMGSDEQRKAMDNLQQVEKTDPLQAGLRGGDAMQGAMATINAASAKQGTDYESRARTIVLALAARQVGKL